MAKGLTVVYRAEFVNSHNFLNCVVIRKTVIKSKDYFHGNPNSSLCPHTMHAWMTRTCFYFGSHKYRRCLVGSRRSSKDPAQIKKKRRISFGQNEFFTQFSDFQNIYQGIEYSLWSAWISGFFVVYLVTSACYDWLGLFKYLPPFFLNPNR